MFYSKMKEKSQRNMFVLVIWAHSQLMRLESWRAEMRHFPRA